MKAFKKFEIRKNIFDKESLDIIKGLSLAILKIVS